ncbi:RidA family protein [Streptomyces sp. NPDC094448]|uniref:RidA family protein n=1 Tax=Streptomyces sp. NPDC094448 TaxID=3366063 RepID=UPI00380E5A68
MTALDSFQLGIPAESDFGYSQAIRSGTLIHVSGQLAFADTGELLHPDDFAAQLRETYARTDRILAHYGATRNQIVSQTLYLVGVQRHAEAGTAGNRAYFGGHRPVSTVVGVTELTFPGQLVEISFVVDTELPA